jgi:hypothetical protein
MQWWAYPNLFSTECRGLWIQHRYKWLNLYIQWNNSPLEKNPIAEPWIKPGTQMYWYRCEENIECRGHVLSQVDTFITWLTQILIFVQAGVTYSIRGTWPFQELWCENFGGLIAIIEQGFFLVNCVECGTLK